MPRATQQFHWLNNGYAYFDGFLATMSSRKRKNIRKERAQAQRFGGDIVVLSGDQIEPEHWDAFWVFYQDTGARKWGTPYLTRAFFDHAQQSLRDDMVLVLARRDGQWVAGALNFVGRDVLYGRYWGCIEHHPCLHFELCYYQAIDVAIAAGSVVSKQVPKVSTNWLAGICRRKRTVCIGSQTKGLPTPSGTTLLRNAKPLRKKLKF